MAIKQSEKMAELMRRMFHESGMSIHRLSTEAKTAYASTHAFVNGQRDPQLSSVERWCEVLGLELRPIKRERG